MICLMFAAIELGIPKKRSASARTTNTAAASTEPQILPAPPIMTMEMIKIDSIQHGPLYSSSDLSSTYFFALFEKSSYNGLDSDTNLLMDAHLMSRYS